MLRVARRTFSSCAALRAGETGTATSRALVFAQTGDPKQVIRAHTYELAALQPGQVRLRFLLSAINPADINVLQGVYPAKPPVRDDIAAEPLSIMGNEAVAVVEGLKEDGQVEQQLKVGDWVVMGKAQQGTWQSRTNTTGDAVFPLPRTHGLNEAQAATLSINPPTAWRMLSDYVPLEPAARPNASKQPWMIQNGANSAVGTAAIQICREWGVKTINLIRDRENADEMKSYLKSLGADHVLTYSEFLKRETRSSIKEWTKDGEMRLALNCVGGKETTEMVKLLSMQGFLVTYGGMAKSSLSIPPGLFIFKRLSAVGFWLSNWVRENPHGRTKMLEELSKLAAAGKLHEPAVEIVDLQGPDSEIATKIRDVLARQESGRTFKPLLRFHD